MIAESGHRLIDPDAIETLKRRLIPLALVVTPNVPEAEALAGIAIRGVDDLKAAGEAIHAFGPPYVLMKGGHMPGKEAIDYLFDGNAWMEFAGERLVTKSTHGTGCTYAAAIAAHLAKGKHIQTAVADSKHYLTECMRRGFTFGKGAGQLNHGWPLDDR
jgi:hydroxymethylpyrimidine/phosphomethylpyrimidine kinase